MTLETSELTKSAPIDEQRGVKKEVICLVGSVKQEKDWRDWNARLTSRGYVVFGAGLYGTLDGGVSQETWELVSRVHWRKIDLSDVVAVIRKKDGTIGTDTLADVEYARSRGKRVVYVEDLINGHSRQYVSFASST